MTSRPGKLLLLAGLALLWGFASQAAAETAKPPRHVVLFVTDDQSPTMGCYGDPVAKTPHMDALAAEGTRYTHAFCTTASCSASRSVILTGLFNHANAQYGHQHSYHHFSSYDWVKGLPVLLDSAGYRTARCGKYHVAPEEVYKFETTLPGDTRNPVQMANNCRDFLQAKDERPFFLYFCTSDPHRGGGVNNTIATKPDRFGNRDEPRTGVTEVKYDPAEVPVPAFLPDTQACRDELAQYYQAVSRIDQGLGRLVEVLKEAGVYEDTMIIFTSDHGMAFPGGKTTVYEGGLRVPFLVRSPDQQQRGVVSDAMISFVDLTPTILDYAGALDQKTGAVRSDLAMRPGRKPQPYRFHGRSFLPTLEGKPVAGWDEINASHTFHEITMYYPMRVVRNRDYKLIWNIAHDLPYPFASDLWAASTWQDAYKRGMDTPYGTRTVKEYIHRPEFELYHIKADPHESKNLADDPEHARALAEMKTKLKEFQKRTADPWIMKWDYE